MDSDDSQSSILAEEVWSVHGGTFDFDDVVLNSRVYRRAWRNCDPQVDYTDVHATTDSRAEPDGLEQEDHAMANVDTNTTEPHFVDMSIVLGNHQAPSLPGIPEQLSFYRVIANEVSSVSVDLSCPYLKLPFLPRAAVFTTRVYGLSEVHRTCC